MARHIYQGVTRDGNGVVIASATISVYLAGTTTAATIYAAETGGSAITTGQTTSGTNGAYSFYVDDTVYAYTQLFDVVPSKANFSFPTLSNQRIIPFLTGATAIGISILTAASEDAAQGAIGATVTGKALIVATNAAAAQTAIGATTVGKAVIVATNEAAAQTAIGATTIGKALIVAADAAAVQAAAGGTTVGKAVFTAASEAAGRTAILALSNKHAVYQDQKSSGTNGGTFTAGDWRTRVLTTEVADTIGASLASNQVTLPAGTYRVVGYAATAGSPGNHQARLYDITGAAVLLLGMITNVAGSPAMVSGVFTLAAPSAVELQHRCSATQADTGMGSPASFGTEVYATIVFEQV